MSRETLFIEVLDTAAEKAKKTLEKDTELHTGQINSISEMLTNEEIMNDGTEKGKLARAAAYQVSIVSNIMVKNAVKNELQNYLNDPNNQAAVMELSGLDSSLDIGLHRSFVANKFNNMIDESMKIEPKTVEGRQLLDKIEKRYGEIGIAGVSGFANDTLYAAGVVADALNSGKKPSDVVTRDKGFVFHESMLSFVKDSCNALDAEYQTSDTPFKQVAIEGEQPVAENTAEERLGFWDKIVNFFKRLFGLEVSRDMQATAENTENHRVRVPFDEIAGTSRVNKLTEGVKEVAKKDPSMDF